MLEDSIVRFFEQGRPMRLVESSYETFFVDIFDSYGIPVELTGATARFHLKEFSTRDHIWTKVCTIVDNPNPKYPGATYPFTVRVDLTSTDTRGLEGHYMAQLEIIDYRGESKIGFQVEIIVVERS